MYYRNGADPSQRLRTKNEHSTSKNTSASSSIPPDALRYHKASSRSQIDLHNKQRAQRNGFVYSETWGTISRLPAFFLVMFIIILFHRRTRTAYVYNGRLAWYNVVLTPRIRSTVKYSQLGQTENICDVSSQPTRTLRCITLNRRSTICVHH